VAAVATRDKGHGALVAQPRTGGPAKLFEPRGETLEDVILGAWEALVAGRHAECPVCGGSMAMLEGCSDCGSELSN
jgi:hypothetical protein